jgi:hypothetical protein
LKLTDKKLGHLAIPMQNIQQFIPTSQPMVCSPLCV